MKKNHSLSLREKLFCIYYANSMDAKQSAIYAGYKKNPMLKAHRLLLRSEISDEIENVSNKIIKDTKLLALTGYRRLAFSDIADAVSLLYMDTVSKETLENMDLFMVQEIKKPKDGALEIKFFDRMKALDNLSKDCESKESSNGLFDALTIAAENLSDQSGDENGL